MGETNRIIGWASLAAGAATGLIMGLWSFDGPAPVPEWLGGYDDVSRRLARLGHIACFGLGILNLLLARELAGDALARVPRRLASVTMNFGNVFLPLTLFVAAAWRPAKYAMSIPATAVFVALAITVWQLVARGSREQS